MPIKKYERMLLGNLAADYIGNKNCLRRCHVHDELNRHFEGSTMGAQLSAASGMMVVDCESCHGPGSAALEETIALDPKKPADRVKIKRIMKKNFLGFMDMPGQARALICLKCHTANATFNIQNWNAGPHALNDVSCSDCHPIHQGADLITPPRAVKDMCMKCHQEVRAEFSLPSHHPVQENKMYCTDCHNPHGTTTEGLLQGITVKETCTPCHTEKGGPYLFEHADVTENCMNCHSNHGSVNNNLLKLRVPFLCLQCHIGHRLNSFAGGASSLESKGAFYTRCTDCHSEIHGTDTPSASGAWRFTQ